MTTRFKFIAMGIAIAGLAGLFAVGCGSVRAGYESAPYKVLRSDGKFEVRAYPALLLAETPMRGSDDSFMRLFRFISGQNTKQEKIPMTTPVYFSSNSSNATMSFVMPKTMAAQSAPRPNDPQVTVREAPGGTFAVLRFSGARNAEMQTKMLAKLETWLAQQKLSVIGGPIYGYFDPPWTPSFLRRNEVMLPVKE